MRKLILWINVIAMGITLVGCRRNSDEVWEDTKSASRYMGRGVRAIGGKHGDSRQVYDPQEFFGNQGAVAANDYEFIPLQDEHGNQMIGMSEANYYPQPKESPGDPGSAIPGIEAFQDPSTNPEFARAFNNVHFDYNSSLIKGHENLQAVRNAVDYLKSHPETYVFVEGHTDERGGEAYNLALGSHRANAIRSMLIEMGADAEHIYTISYGKEHPILFDHHEEAWSVNRRGEFKVYQNR